MRPAQHQVETVPCPTCGSERPRRVLRRSGLRVVECLVCGLLYTSPRLAAQAREALYALEDAKRRAKATERVAPPYDRFAERLARLEPWRGPGARLLDVGCGFGHFLLQAQEAGWAAEGLDVSAFACQEAARRVGAPVHQGTLPQLAPRLAARPFDAVTMWQLLEHVEHPLDDLSAARRVLRPGGALAVACPDATALTMTPHGLAQRVFLPGFRHRHYQSMPRIHLVHFTPATLGAHLSQAGFEVLWLESRAIDPAVPAKSAWRGLLNRVFAALEFPFAMACLARAPEGPPSPLA